MSSVSMSIEALQAKPEVIWTHIDGPVIYWAGRMHWLTLTERVLLAFNFTTIEQIAQKHWPQRKKFATLTAE